MSSPDSPLSRESDSGRDDRSDSGTDTGSYNSMERSRPRKDRPAKKQKKRRIDFRSRYIDYAAEEAAEDEEEERELQAELRTRGITEEQYHQEVSPAPVVGCEIFIPIVDCQSALLGLTVLSALFGIIYVFSHCCDMPSVAYGAYLFSFPYRL